MTTKSQRSKEKSIQKTESPKKEDDLFEGDEALQILEILEKSPTDPENDEILQEARRLFPSIEGPIEIKMNLQDD